MKPMLAGKAVLDKLVYPLYASPKIDGVRALNIGGELLSRKLETFPNPHVNALYSNDDLAGLDGELVVGEPTDQQVRNATSGAMNRKYGEPPVRFFVFDYHDAGGTFKERYDHLQRSFGGGQYPGVVLVPHVLINSERELFEYEDFKLGEGYEGLIIRSLDGLYKHGRSTTNEGWMLKLKRFEDAEAKVLRVNEEMENTNPAKRDNLGRTKRSKARAGMVGKGRAGELEVVGINGQFQGTRFVVPLGGAGDVGKAWWWKDGRKALKTKDLVVTYRFFPKGVKDKPLLPTYVGLREDWDR